MQAFLSRSLDDLVEFQRKNRPTSRRSFNNHDVNKKSNQPRRRKTRGAKQRGSSTKVASALLSSLPKAEPFRPRQVKKGQNLFKNRLINFRDSGNSFKIPFAPRVNKRGAKVIKRRAINAMQNNQRRRNTLDESLTQNLSRQKARFAVAPKKVRKAGLLARNFRVAQIGRGGIISRKRRLSAGTNLARQLQLTNRAGNRITASRFSNALLRQRRLNSRVKPVLRSRVANLKARQVPFVDTFSKGLAVGDRRPKSHNISLIRRRKSALVTRAPATSWKNSETSSTVVSKPQKTFLEKSFDSRLISNIKIMASLDKVPDPLPAQQLQPIEIPHAYMDYDEN